MINSTENHVAIRMMSVFTETGYSQDQLTNGYEALAFQWGTANRGGFKKYTDALRLQISVGYGLQKPFHEIPADFLPGNNERVAGL